MNNFESRYKKLSNFELLQILEQRADYQPEAVLVAEKEIASRNLSDKERSDAQNKINEVQETEHEKENNKRARNIKVSRFIHFLDPTVKKTTEQIVKATVIILALTILYSIVSEFNLYRYTFSAFVNGDPSFLFLFVPTLFSCLILYAVWQKQKIGWFLFLIWMFVVIIISFLDMRMEMSSGPLPGMFESLFPSKGIAFYVGNIIVYTGFIVFYLSNKVRLYFNFKPKK